MIGKVENAEEYGRLCLYCFGGQGYGLSKVKPKEEEEVAYFDNADCRLGIFDEISRKGGQKEKILASALIMIPFVVKSNRQVFQCLGIRGVTSKPEYRNKGHIRKLFMEVFRLMKEKNIPISNLYPFKHAYYEKFGYMLSEEVSVLRFDPADLTNLRNYPEAKNLRIKEVLGANRIHEDIVSVYQQCIQKFDYCLMERSKWGWEQFTMCDEVFQFVCYEITEENEWKPVGYVIWHLERNLDHWYTRICGVTKKDIAVGVRGGAFIIREMNWTNTAVKVELFRFLWKHRVQLKTCCMILPLGEDISFYFQDPERLQRKIEPKTQTRIVLLQKVIESIKVSVHHDLDVSIKVLDESCSWNDGVWKLTKKKGEDEVKATKVPEEDDDVDVDIVMDIKLLTMIILGIRTIDDVLASLPIEIKSVGSEGAVLGLRCYEKRLFNFFNDLF